MQLNIPIILTWLRIAAIPLFVAVLYFPEWGLLSVKQANIAATVLFIAAAVTDWFDGY
ncbi:MAG: CDP-alcohol phosphatidyltransferase family protein, partial [Burkholderiales bacterium]